ncbi:ATP-binding protein [Kribbella sp. NPDC058693]|uniref:ATP-binding protein n=1 Tax=Kribbella sp. NPDC058693 TaxID=3346602 RepID=UPI003656E377
MKLESRSAVAFRGVVLPADAALAATRLGLEPSELRARHLDGAFCAALTHDSYLYEHQADAPHLTPGVLRALLILGSRWMTRELAVSAYRRRHFEKVGPLSDVVAYARPRIASWASTLDWLPQAGLYGRSLEVTQLSGRIVERILLQLIGLLCLMGEDEKVRRFVAPFLDRIHREAAGTPLLDSTSTLQQVLHQTTLSVEWSQDATGPDHARQFAARLTDSRGRTAYGNALSKKGARAAAADEYLKRYFPDALAPLPVQAPRRPLGVPPEATAAHRRTVARIVADFELDSSSTPLVSQAFMHSSWTYENQRGVRACGQRDNQILAFVGSHVLDYEFAMSLAQRAVVNPPENSDMHNLRNDSYAEAFNEMRLGPALLLSVGQVGKIETEMAANAFQAAMGAVFLSRQAPSTLLEQWPDLWRNATPYIAPAVPTRDDPATRLQELSSAADLLCDYEYSITGPDHLKQYAATLIVSSAALRRRLRIKGGGTTNKTKAKQAAATKVISAANRLAEQQPALIGRTDRSRVSPVVISFLAQHFAEVAGLAPAKARLWSNRQIFGAHHASRPDELALWASAVDQLLDETGESLNADHLAQYFRSAMASDETTQGSLRSELRWTLEWLSELAAPADIDDHEVARLVQLASAYRAIGADQADGSLRELMLTDWPVLYRNRIDVVGDVPDLILSTSELALIDSIAKALPKDHDALTARVMNGVLTFGPVRVPPDQARLLLRVWGEVSPRIQLSVDGEEVRCALPDNHFTDAGPLLTAVRSALKPSAQPLGAAVANLLHDLKNELSAARQAARTTGGGRTAELRRQADASEHLDQSKALALRIRAATSLLRAPGDESVCLAEFLRSYVASALLRLDPRFTLIAPRSSHDVSVGLDESALRAVVDNLVKNALEAMPDGGTISLEWMQVDEYAVLEVADDGPGLPRGVADALAGGHRVTSTKPGGNGLGLVGVRALLHRIGGSLEVGPSRQGARWQVTIPVVTDATAGEPDAPDLT